MAPTNLLQCSIGSVQCFQISDFDQRWFSPFDAIYNPACLYFRWFCNRYFRNQEAQGPNLVFKMVIMLSKIKAYLSNSNN